MPREPTAAQLPAVGQDMAAILVWLPVPRICRALPQVPFFSPMTKPCGLPALGL